MNETEPPKKVTLSGKPADPEYHGGAPQPIDPATGMHRDYWVLSEAERAKGFVRPVRRTYIHVGERPKYPLRDLTPDEHTRYDQFKYVKYEAYPEDDAITGRFWTDKALNSGCGASTTMGTALAETYARDPSFYGATFCVHCGAHYPVAEFVWEAAGDRRREILGS